MFVLMLNSPLHFCIRTWQLEQLDRRRQQVLAHSAFTIQCAWHRYKRQRIQRAVVLIQTGASVSLTNAQHTASFVGVLLRMRCGCPVVGTECIKAIRKHRNYCDVHVRANMGVCRAHVHTLLTCAVAAVRGWLARRLRVKTIRAVLWLQRAARLFLQRQRAKTGEST